MLSQTERESAQVGAFSWKKTSTTKLGEDTNLDDLQGPLRLGLDQKHDEENENLLSSFFARYRSERDLGRWRYVANDASIFVELDESYVARVSNRFLHLYNLRPGRSRSQGANDRYIEILLDVFGRPSRPRPKRDASSLSTRTSHDIFKKDPRPRYVEFGFESLDLDKTKQANTLRLRAKGFPGLLLDARNENPEIGLYQHYLDATNIASILQQRGVENYMKDVKDEPQELHDEGDRRERDIFDFLSIDVDSYDIFLFEAILEAGYRPKIVSTEYNPNYWLSQSIAHVDPGLVRKKRQQSTTAASVMNTVKKDLDETRKAVADLDAASTVSSLLSTGVTGGGAGRGQDEDSSQDTDGVSVHVAEVRRPGLRRPNETMSAPDPTEDDDDDAADNEQVLEYKRKSKKKKIVVVPRRRPVHLAAAERLRQIQETDEAPSGEQVNLDAPELSQGDCSLGSSAAALKQVADKFGYVLVGIIRHLDLIWMRKDLIDAAVERNCGSYAWSEGGGDNEDEGKRDTFTVKKLYAKLRRQICLGYFQVPPFEYFFSDVYKTQQEYELLHAWPAYELAKRPLRKELVHYNSFVRTGNVTKSQNAARATLRRGKQLLCFKNVYETLY
ncbi:unnamed protein product [Amoebophrya sp. A25]|nr:unnamed protein product [Amoebophrya sp. A25]|eukprot:GSA25T00009793001.1